MSIIEKISYKEYVKSCDVRQARNKWIHRLRRVDGSASYKALELAEEFFRQYYPFNATVPPFASRQTFLLKKEDEKHIPKDVKTREFPYPLSNIHDTGLDQELRNTLVRTNNRD